MLQWRYESIPGDLEPPVVVSNPVSTARSWAWLFSRGRKWGNKAAAIVFSLPEHAWPIKIYIQMANNVLVQFLKWHQNLPEEARVMSGDEVRSCSDAARIGWPADVEMLVRSSKILGASLHHFRSFGGTLESCDGMEVVIGCPIPPSFIERIVPLYQSNREFKAMKERSRPKNMDDAI
jgi:hypothetical protein